VDLCAGAFPVTGYSESRKEGAFGDGAATRDRPPQAPAFRRRLTPTRKQKIGLPLIVAIPILTLIGVFGERSAETHATSANLAVDVRYPDRFRYRQVEALAVSVRNLAPTTIDTMHVSLDTAYVTRFAGVRIEPSPRDAFVVDLLHVKAGESRLVTMELTGDRYGRHRGRIVVSTPTDTVPVHITTLVFP
jgi:hypothetical protein